MLAEVVCADWKSSGVAAVARSAIGKGSITCFFYDLAEAVARIRFGNLDLASYATTETWAWPHPCDMCQDHVDESLFHLPQADLHQQFLAGVLTQVCPFLLPRLMVLRKT